MILAGILAVGIWWLYAAPPGGDTNQNNSTPSPSTSPTASMYARMKGDEFDKAYISDMIAHHQGALNMASFATSQASKDEIKRLSSAIISTQTAEAQTMQQWQQQWG